MLSQTQVAVLLSNWCPNLDIKSVFAVAYKCFNFQALFKSLEKQLNLPTVLIDGRYRGGAERGIDLTSIHSPNS